LGSTLAGSAVYYYVLQEYKTSNELLTGDIYVRVAPCLQSVSLLELRYNNTFPYRSTRDEATPLMPFPAQALQHAVERVSKYLSTLEDKMEALERKKK